MQNSLWCLRDKAEPHWYLMYHLLMVRHGFLLGLRKTVLERLRRVGHQQLWGLCSHRPTLQGWKGWKQWQPDVVESAGFGDGIDSAPSTVSGLVLLSAFLDSHSTESGVGTGWWREWKGLHPMQTQCALLLERWWDCAKEQCILLEKSCYFWSILSCGLMDEKDPSWKSSSLSFMILIPSESIFRFTLQ